MKTLTILSGKGGVGKSSLTASLAVLLAEKHKIVAADCDVDAPNLALVFGLEKFTTTKKIQTNEKAKLIPEKCTASRKCLTVCNFGAISWDKKNKQPVFDKYLCEGCGSCGLICPSKAVKLIKIQNAEISVGKTNYGFPVVSGQLKMGESGSGKVVTEVKAAAEKIAEKQNADFMIVDSSPGIGCPVIASIQGSDYVIAVTEPTPSAFNDLKRVLQVVEYFRIPYGIVINRWDINQLFAKKIEIFAKKYKIPIIGKVPYDKIFVKSLVNLKPVVILSPRIKKIFLQFLINIPFTRKLFK